MELATRKTLDRHARVGEGVGRRAGRATASTTAAIRRRTKGKEKAAINEDHQVYFHKVGTPQSQDALIYEDKANPQRFHIARDDRGRALRDPDDLGARQGQGRQRAVRRATCRRASASSRRSSRRSATTRFNVARQRRRQAAGRHQPQRAERAGRPRRSEAAGGGELEDDPAGEAGTAAGRQARPAASCSRPT